VAPALLPQVSIALGVLRSLTQGAEAIIQVSEAIADGYHAARCCPQILTYRFEEMWERPLADVVREIGLPQVPKDRPYALRPGPHPIPTV
jgi:ubiquinone biosynthesis protein Coq4